MRLRFSDILTCVLFGALASWFARGFFYGDTSLHNFELVSNYFTRAIQLLLYIAAVIVLLGVIYTYVLVRTKQFQWRKVLFPLIAMTLGLWIVYPVVSHVYERSLVAREPVHSFLQLFPSPIPEEVLAPDRKETVIACLGGSTTAWGDEQYRKWTQLLEEKLKGEGYNVRVLNQGRPWFTTMHSRYNYQSNVRRARPDVVVMMHAINDVQMNGDESYYSNGEFREDYGHYMGPFARQQNTQPLASLVWEVARRSWYFPKRKQIDSEDFVGLETFKRNVRDIAHMVESDGAKLVLMTQGTLYKDNMTEEEKDKLYLAKFNSTGEHSQWTFERARSGIRQYNQAIRACAKELEVKLVDLEQTVPKDLDHFNDDVHLRGPAMDVISTKLAAELKEFLD